MLRKSIVVLTLAVGAALTLGTALVLPETAMAQDAGKIGAKVGKPLKAAVEAANQKKDWAEALAKLKEADAVPNKNAFEQHQINELYGFVKLQQRQYTEAANYYERGLNSGQLPADQTENRLKLLAQLYFQTRNLPKAIDYGSRWLKATGGNDAEMNVLVGQAYYLSKNYQKAVEHMRTAVKAADTAGKKPDENWLLILNQSYAQLKDVKGANLSMHELVRRYPKPEYWNILTSALLRAAPNDDRITLNIYRLMYELDVLDSADDYSEMAIIALQQGLPGEAQKVMEQGYASKVLTAAGDQARSQRILNQAKQQAAEDQRTLAQQEQEAKSASTGQADIALGQAFMSYGQPEKAVEAYQRGITKGGLKSTDDAYMLLGEAWVRLKNGAEARKAFSQVKGEDMRDIAALWSVYAGQLG